MSGPASSQTGRVPADLDPLLRPEKLSGYALNPNATETGGDHKARLLGSILGLGPDDADGLREQLLDGVLGGTVTGTRETPWGLRYQVEIPIHGNNDRTVNVETVWQVEPDGTTLKFLTIRSIEKDR